MLGGVAAFLIAAAIAVPHPQHGPSNPSPPHHAASSAPISSSTAGKVSNVTSTHEKLASLVRAVQLIKDHLGVGHDLFDIANSRSGDSASLRSLKGSDVAAMSQQSQQQTYQETLDDATKMGVSPQGSATAGVEITLEDENKIAGGKKVEENKFPAGMTQGDMLVPVEQRKRLKAMHTARALSTHGSGGGKSSKHHHHEKHTSHKAEDPAAADAERTAAGEPWTDGAVQFCYASNVTTAAKEAFVGAVAHIKKVWGRAQHPRWAAAAARGPHRPPAQRGACGTPTLSARPARIAAASGLLQVVPGLAFLPSLALTPFLSSLAGGARPRLHRRRMAGGRPDRRRVDDRPLLEVARDLRLLEPHRGVLRARGDGAVRRVVAAARQVAGAQPRPGVRVDWHRPP